MTKTKPLSWLHPALQARNTSRIGQGIFAKTSIARGETLFIQGGYVIRVADEVDNDKGLQIDENFILTDGGGGE